MSGAGTTSETRKAFGPSAIATPANALTMARLVASPILAVLVGVVGPSSWLLFVLWMVLAGSDGLDGHLARRHGSTRSGAFLDPLADKFLVLGALAALAAAGVVGWLPVVLIFLREAAMSAFRVYAGRRGVSVPARPLAKLKTLLQDLAVAMALFPPIGASHAGAVRVTLWIAVALTIYTGAEYLLDARKLLRVAGTRAV
ncbi:MAG: phosphatidylglycerophosphate synthase [Acidimicrobiaceae bacterium]|jgi:CDP-diacylglycerol--glycerol-3-phosphate 3-phosphatidyltransferase|nr:phosphatidylglycerophosphate synthase [Acidimicrobiaceae bacterium]